jgi:protein TonB
MTFVFGKGQGMAVQARWKAGEVQPQGWAANPPRILWLGLLGAFALLPGCGSDPAPAETAQAPPQAVVTSTPQSVEPSDVEPAASRAETALRAQRLFAPAGDNAFELFLQAVQDDPGDERSRTALLDLLPYAVLHIEQRLGARDRAEATRVLGLLQQTQPDAPAIPRLQRALLALPEETRAQGAAPAGTPEVATPAPLNPVSAEPVAPATPPTLPTGAVGAAQEAEGLEASALPSPAAPPGPSENPPIQEAAPTTASAPDAPPAESVAASSTTAGLPRVLRQVAPKYPPAAGRRRQEGQVEVGFTINPDGRVSDVQVISSDPPRVFDRAAIAAMEDWSYEAPGRSIRTSRTFVFRME